jgi:hypothetical protein
MQIQYTTEFSTSFIILYTFKVPPDNCYSDILHRDDPQHQLRLIDVQKLHNAFRTYYSTWVRDAPQAWTSDGFLTYNVPISIAVRYGQNQPIVNRDSLNQEATNWLRERNYSQVCHLAVAIATNIWSVIAFLLVYSFIILLIFLAQIKSSILDP